MKRNKVIPLTPMIDAYTSKLSTEAPADSKASKEEYPISTMFSEMQFAFYYVGIDILTETHMKNRSIKSIVMHKIMNIMLKLFAVYHFFLYAYMFATRTDSATVKSNFFQVSSCNDIYLCSSFLFY